MPGPRNPDAKAELERLLRERDELRAKLEEHLQNYRDTTTALQNLQKRIFEIRRQHGPHGED